MNSRFGLNCSEDLYSDKSVIFLGLFPIISGWISFVIDDG